MKNQPIGLGYVNCWVVGPEEQKTRKFNIWHMLDWVRYFNSQPKAYSAPLEVRLRLTSKRIFIQAMLR